MHATITKKHRCLMLHFIVTLYLVSMLNVTIIPWKVLNVTIHRKMLSFRTFLDIECLMFQISLCNVTSPSHCNISLTNLAEWYKFNSI